MKKVIRLTESDLNRLVRRIIGEQWRGSLSRSYPRVSIPKTSERHSHHHDLMKFEKAVRGRDKKTIIDHTLDLSGTDVRSLGNLVAVKGDLYLLGTSKLTTLGSLERVDGDLYLSHSNIESLGVLNYVGGDLRLEFTPISDMTEDEIRSEVEVGGDIYLGG